MKLELNKKEFLKHIDNIIKAVTVNPALPSLHGILITATESNIQLLASDGILAIKEIVENNSNNKVVEPGKILVSGRLFREIISKQGETIELSTKHDSIEIMSEGSKTNINLLNVNDFPIISFETYGKDLTVDADRFRELIKNVSFAAADGDKRLILNGVNLQAQDGKLIATATNSYRLAQEVMNIDSNVEFNITILSKNIKDYLPTTAKGLITINVDDSKIITRVNSTTTLSKLIDGIYPEVTRLIPTSFNSRLIIETRELEKLVDRATVVSEESKKVIRLSINKNELLIESRKSEVGETNVKTTNFDWNGDQFAIAFNAQFLKEAITKFEGKISINFVADQKPFVIKSDNKPGITQLILPHRSF